MTEFNQCAVTEIMINGCRLKQIEVLPTLKNLTKITSFIDKTKEEMRIPMNLYNTIDIAMDEIFSNIVYYSGASKVLIACGYDGNHAILQFLDDGKQYNPLEKEDPDITLDVDERQIGGLGIFIVIKMMSDMQYSFEHEMNCLLLISK